MRADAQRNRSRVLEAADEAFAAEGLAVPVHEIARRAGVGTGTVSRHFPTKEALYEAVFMRRVERLIERAETLSAAADPGEAFFAFFADLAAEGAANRGLAEALAGAGFDLEAVSTGDHNVMGHLAYLLTRAQQAGAVRPDTDPADVKALLAACLSRDAAGRARLLAVARTGLRP